MYGIVETLVVVLGWYIILCLMLEIHILIHGFWNLFYDRGISCVIWNLVEAHGWNVDDVIGTLIEALVDDPNICLVHSWHMLLTYGWYTQLIIYYDILYGIDVHGQCTWALAHGMAHDVHSWCFFHDSLFIVDIYFFFIKYGMEWFWCMDRSKDHHRKRKSLLSSWSMFSLSSSICKRSRLQ